MSIGRIKLAIKILIGREIFFRRQIHVSTTELGNSGGSFPVLSDCLQGNRPLTVFSFGVGEDLSFSEGVLAAAKQAHVYAFDPTPKAIRFVENHPLATDERFSFYPCGISDKDGMEAFYLPKNENYVSGSVVQYDGVSGEKKLLVEMRTLSSILEAVGTVGGYIDILKMDIEGSEFRVIPEILESGCQFDQLCIEVHHRFFPDGKKKVRKLVKDLNEHGYYIAQVLESGQELLFVKAR